MLSATGKAVSRPRALGHGIPFWDCITNLYKKSCDAFVPNCASLCGRLYVGDSVVDSIGTCKRFGINSLLLTRKPEALILVRNQQGIWPAGVNYQPTNGER